ncbi:hypothetical protein [Variovorax sp. UC122_21]|uniref:hypothetical protein n=1 Tax=Variovorax sp. UC122_21 TaxID=3374554 RepID=UPI003757F4D7
MSKETHHTLRAIQNLAGEDLDGTSDVQIRGEFIEDGFDPDAEASRIAASIDGVVAAFMRAHTASAKREATSRRSLIPMVRPTLEKIRALIERACASEPALAASYRKGSKQSEADLETMYDDLVALGKIDPSDVYD